MIENIEALKCLCKKVDNELKNISRKCYEQGRKDAIEEIEQLIDDVDADSTYLYIKIDKEKIALPFFRMKKEVREWLHEKMQEISKQSEEI